MAQYQWIKQSINRFQTAQYLWITQCINRFQKAWRFVSVLIDYIELGCDTILLILESYPRLARMQFLAHNRKWVVGSEPWIFVEGHGSSFLHTHTHTHTHVYALLDSLLIRVREHVSHGQDVYNSKPWKVWLKYEMKAWIQGEVDSKILIIKLDHFSFRRYLETKSCDKRSGDTKYLWWTFQDYTMHIQIYQRVEVNHNLYFWH